MDQTNRLNLTHFLVIFSSSSIGVVVDIVDVVVVVVVAVVVIIVDAVDFLEPILTTLKYELQEIQAT